MPDHRPNEPHLIWSMYWNAWFRPAAHGYTDDISKAGIFRGRGVNEERERKVYLDEAIADIISRRAELTRQVEHLADIEAQLRLYQPTEEPANA